mgnify:CR=1 FL=1
MGLALPKHGREHLTAVGSFIKKRREARQMPVDVLALICGVSRTTMVRMEAGATPITPKAFAVLQDEICDNEAERAEFKTLVNKQRGAFGVALL